MRDGCADHADIPRLGQPELAAIHRSQGGPSPNGSQYLGRCEIAHSRACSIGPRGGCDARKRCTVGSASILSCHWRKTGYLAYMALPSRCHSRCRTFNVLEAIFSGYLT